MVITQEPSILIYVALICVDAWGAASCVDDMYYVTLCMVCVNRMIDACVYVLLLLLLYRVDCIVL